MPLRQRINPCDLFPTKAVQTVTTTPAGTTYVRKVRSVRHFCATGIFPIRTPGAPRLESATSSLPGADHSGGCSCSKAACQRNSARQAAAGDSKAGCTPCLPPVRRLCASNTRSFRYRRTSKRWSCIQVRPGGGARPLRPAAAEKVGRGRGVRIRSGGGAYREYRKRKINAVLCACNKS